jgi:hypothetical protein
VIGYVLDSGGVGVVGATVNITDLRTGLYNNTTVSLTDGFYSYDLGGLGPPGSWLPGDDVMAVAWAGPLSGSNQTTLIRDDYDWLNVTLGVVVPEFPTVIVPISGMLVLFAVVSLKRRGDEL